MTAIPSTPPMGIPRNSHQSRSGSPTKSGSQPGGYPGPTGSPVPPMPPQSYQQVGADLTDNVANFAQSTFSTFSNFLQKPEKLAPGKDTKNKVEPFTLSSLTLKDVQNDPMVRRLAAISHSIMLWLLQFLTLTSHLQSS
jgi:hypothetical protein